jgi:hypothetical protein
MPNNTTHLIKITADYPGSYSTSGAVAVKSAFNPMKAAGVALLAAGRDPADKLKGVYEGAWLSPVTLARLSAAYHAPRTDHRKGGFSFNVDA